MFASLILYYNRMSFIFARSYIIKLNNEVQRLLRKGAVLLKKGMKLLSNSMKLLSNNVKLLSNGVRLLRKPAALLMTILILLNASACGTKKQSRYEAGFLKLFDTKSQIVAYTDSKAEFTRHSQLIYDSLKELHELYDIYNDYEGINNLKTVNDNAGIAPVKVDRRIIDLIRFAREWYDKTDGRINIAYGAVLRIWHDYRTEGIENPEEAQLPPMDKLREAQKHTDINRVIINEEESTVYLEDPDMSLDVGAVAKGYAVEQVSRIAEEDGFKSGLISVGGNVRAIGSKGESGMPWNVGVQNPNLYSEKKELHILDLTDLSLVTSGIYERFFTVNGRSYHHIIDPQTLFPSEYYQAVTIVCRDSGVADALSTSVFNMPFDQGLEFIEGLEDAEAMWVMSDGELRYSDHFRDLIKQ